MNTTLNHPRERARHVAVSRQAIMIATLIGALLGTVLSWFAATPPAGAAADPGGFTSLPPSRILDSRRSGPCITTRNLAVAGQGGVQSDAAAVVLNVTVTGASGGGYATVYPTGAARPIASNINYLAGQTVANSVTVKLGTGGSISLFANAGCPNMIVDVAGFFRSSGGSGPGQFSAVTPFRLVNTRTRATPYCSGGAAASVPVQTTGVGGVPAGAVAAVVNLTVTAATRAGSLTTSATGAAAPEAATNLSYATGETVAAASIVQLSSAGSFTVQSRGGCPVIIADVLGFVGRPSSQGATAGQVIPVAPTRISTGGARPTVCSGEITQTIAVSGIAAPVTGTPLVPSSAASVLLSVTAANPSGGGFLTVYPAGKPLPTASNINYSAGRSASNLVSVGPNGGNISIYTNAGCPQVAVDVVGYTTKPKPGSVVPVVVPSLIGATAVATGERHSCARLSDSNVKCWGANNLGQLGIGPTPATTSTPTAVSGLGPIINLTAGSNHSCAVIPGVGTAPGTGPIKCWGSNSVGQLGNGTTVTATTPVTVTGIAGARKVAAGLNRTCAIIDAAADGVVTNDTVQCWGTLATSSLSTSSTPVDVAGIVGATSVSVGTNSACAIVSLGAVKCWGSNTDGALGDGTTVNPVGAVSASGVTAALHISVGSGFACAQSSVSVKCWGSNSSGQLGDGTTINRPTPVAVSGLAAPRSISAGSSHTCAVDSAVGGIEYLIRCWGGNGDGQLGTNSTTNSARPSVVKLAVPAALPLDSIDLTDSSGGSHTCGLASFLFLGSDVVCWGSNSDGQLGPGAAR